MAMETGGVVCKPNLDGRQILIFMRGGVLVCVVVVVVTVVFSGECFLPVM